MIISFTVTGTPQPAGSKRGFPVRRRGGAIGVSIVDANPKSRDWKNYVTSVAQNSYKGPLLMGALKVTMFFNLMRPKGHFGAKGLRPSAPQSPTVKPDVLKLARGVEDALTGVIWRDDAQIVSEHIYKHYSVGTVASVNVRIEYP